LEKEKIRDRYRRHFDDGVSTVRRERVPRVRRGRRLQRRQGKSHSLSIQARKTLSETVHVELNKKIVQHEMEEGFGLSVPPL
jgi:hypothetical protein